MILNHRFFIWPCLLYILLKQYLIFVSVHPVKYLYLLSGKHPAIKQHPSSCSSVLNGNSGHFNSMQSHLTGKIERHLRFLLRVFFAFSLLQRCFRHQIVVQFRVDVLY